MDTRWSVFSEGGQELCANYRGNEEHARKMAQRFADELGAAVELCRSGSKCSEWIDPTGTEAESDDDDSAAMEEAREDVREGRVISHEELVRRLGLDGKEVP